MVYRVKWLNVPHDLADDKLKDLLNKMATIGFVFVGIEYFRNYSYAAVIFKHE